MGLKDLLVHVDDDPTSSSRVDVAVALAAKHGVDLTGLHGMTGMASVAGLSRGRAAAELPGGAAPASRGARPPGRGAVPRSSTTARESAASGESAPVTSSRRRSCTPDTPTSRSSGRVAISVNAPYDLAFLPEELALGVGRPVLVVPRYGTFETVGERVLIAWNGSREATRAVHDAIPLLQLATKVTVLSIDPDAHTGRRVPSADIALHLARHGVTAEAASDVGVDIGVGDLLLSRAADLGVDLIVMGAYGHSRVREMVLGGATRQHDRARADVPLRSPLDTVPMPEISMIRSQGAEVRRYRR